MRLEDRIKRVLKSFAGLQITNLYQIKNAIRDEVVRFIYEKYRVDTFNDWSIDVSLDENSSANFNVDEKSIIGREVMLQDAVKLIDHETKIEVYADSLLEAQFKLAQRLKLMQR